MEQKPIHPINYLYFGAIFILLVLISAGSVFTKENLGGSQFFFFLYALGQVILETSLFIFLGLLIRRYLSELIFSLFISVTFIAVIIHMLDFLMDRILDLSFWQALRIFVFDESFDNFMFLLDASGIAVWSWILLALALLSLPFLGVGIYKLCGKVAYKRPLIIKPSFFVQTFFCVPCALLFWDFSASKVIEPDVYSAFIKSLPWKLTFMHPKNVLFPVGSAFVTPKSEKEVAEEIEQDQTVLLKKPNIYLFVIESLREDAITDYSTPNLDQFKKEYTSFNLALSNANGTNLSWFSIFYSQFPQFWNQFQKMRNMGSPPLNLLKKWGYQIHLYTSAQLGYYGMEKLLFGKNRSLLDSCHTFHHGGSVSAAISDAAAIHQLQKDMQENPDLQSGQVFIIFFDTTHFDYSWPKNWTPKFTPYASGVTYFKAFQSQKTIQQIKNRYLNSVNYMDSLFGEFFEHLPNKEEAIVVVTADHGEEFFEHGHLFHNSHLTQQQIHIPLYFKFGDGKRQIENQRIVSQMDIFPSILDYLGGKTYPSLMGKSLFQKDEWPFAVTARFNGGQTPYEFCIHNGQSKLIAQFLHRKDIFRSKEIQIISLKTKNDKEFPECKDCIEGFVQSEFGAALNRLFP